MKVLVLDTPNIHGRVVCDIIRKLTNDDVEVELFAVCDKGGYCTNDKLCEGLVYGLFGGWDIINISLGLPYVTYEVRDIIGKLLDKDVKIVCASGNNCVCYPSKLDGVISVGACNEDGKVTDYTVEGSFDVLRLGSYEYKGKIYHGTSFSTARYTGELAKELGKNE